MIWGSQTGLDQSPCSKLGQVTKCFWAPGCFIILPNEMAVKVTNTMENTGLALNNSCLMAATRVSWFREKRCEV